MTAVETWGERLLTQVGTLLDTAALRGLALVIDHALNPSAEDIERMRAAVAPNMTPALQAEPARFFVDSSQNALPTLMCSNVWRPLPHGQIIGLEFASDYQPFVPGALPNAAENDTVHVQHWVHDTPAAATVLALHGFTMGQPRLDAFVLLAPQWYEAGLDVALMTLPFHGARAPRVAGFSGEVFASPDPAQLNEAVRQAVHDVRRMVRWLRTTSLRPVGLLGLSLGGYVAALLGGLDSTLDFVIPMAAPSSLADVAWRFYRSSRHSAAAPPFSRDELAAAYRVHCPLAHPLRVPRARCFIVAGRGDRVVVPRHALALWHHWGEPAMHWFSGGHLAPFRRPRIVAHVLQHLRSLGIQ